MTITIRPAQPGDAKSVADAHITAWRVAYRGVISDAFLDSPQFAQSRHDGWRRRLDAERPINPDLFDEILVPVMNGRVVGFGHIGIEGSTEPSMTGELQGFYIHPEAWGSGAAVALIEACHATFAERFTKASLWVLRDNPRARRFYERHGWSCGSGDEIVEDVWSGPQMAGMPKFEPVAEVQYRRVLDPTR
jgi:GNAT superfamily N-acetyltransferase